jgi:tetratricopeptide (TPR) repeat protein
MNKFKENIYLLAKDRPLKTTEFHEPNDYYGHATILKNYLGLNIDYPIKAAIEHGLYLTRAGWDYDLRCFLPGLITLSSFRHPFLSHLTKKNLFSIGPIIHYAENYMGPDIISAEKKRLGKNLLVFPAHSTHWVDVDFDIHGFCQIIDEFGKDFDSIRVCLYWKDLLRGLAVEYEKRGFECVTAGHIYDPSFLSRLKSIIETSTHTLSNKIGTVLGYCIFFKKPHFLIESQLNKKSSKKKMLEECTDLDNNIDSKKIRDAFSEINEEVTLNQIHIANRYWGFDEIKTKKELINIFKEAEYLYQRKQKFFIAVRDELPINVKSNKTSSSKIVHLSAQDIRVARKAAFRNQKDLQKMRDDSKMLVLNKNDHESTLKPINHTIEKHNDISALDYSKAIALAQIGQKKEAMEALTKFLENQPNHKNAQVLFEALKQECENSLKDNDIVIASYPRSGNTWLRLLLSDIILQLNGFETDTLLPIHQDYVIPNIHDKNLHKIDPRVSLPFRLIKTHQKYSKIPQKTLFLFRHPADALCSYYYFHLRYEHLKKIVEGGIDKFCLQNVDEWCEHLASYIDAKNISPDKIFFISYELLHYQAVMALKEITEFLDLKINEQMFKKAIANHTFQKQYQQEKISGEIGTKYSEHFFRKGSVGTHMEELKKETIAHINAKAFFLYKQALDFQNRLDSHHKGENAGFA